jgi:hypothetical protein
VYVGVEYRLQGPAHRDHHYSGHGYRTDGCQP